MPDALWLVLGPVHREGHETDFGNLVELGWVPGVTDHIAAADVVLPAPNLRKRRPMDASRRTSLCLSLPKSPPLGIPRRLLMMVVGVLLLRARLLTPTPLPMLHLPHLPSLSHPSLPSPQSSLREQQRRGPACSDSPQFLSPLHSRPRRLLRPSQSLLSNLSLPPQNLLCPSPSQSQSRSLNYLPSLNKSKLPRRPQR